MQTVNYRKGLGAMSVCFFVWGFQPLYWYMCTNVCGEIDTFFIMACRIIWAAVACLCILKVQGKLPQLWAVFKDKQVLKREMPASVLLFGDWLVYLWAVQNGRVLECSLGYYIQPLVVFALGAVIFREKMNWRHFVIIAIVVVGIVFSTSGFGGVPYVTIALALMFSIYAAIKKSLTIDSIVSTTSEILMMVPVALLFILFFRMGDNGMGSMTVVKQLLMIGGGVPFCIAGGTMLSQHTGGILSHLPPLKSCFVVLAKPATGVSTARAYGDFDSASFIYHPNKVGMLDAAANADFEGICRQAGNVFEQTIEVPERVRIKSIMRRHGSSLAQMSGSGPTVFGLFESESDAEKCRAELEKSGLVKSVHLCKTADKGVETVNEE